MQVFLAINGDLYSLRISEGVYSFGVIPQGIAWIADHVIDAGRVGFGRVNSAQAINCQACAPPEVIWIIVYELRMPA